jgi:hypothetical protein
MMPPELLALMKRFNQLGLLLPRDDDALEDPLVRAEAELILKEMALVRAQIDSFIAAAREP